MIELKKGETSQAIIVTLTELVTISPVFFLFVFEHVSTKAIVSFVAPDDESLYPERFNKFTINTEMVFGAHPPGEWHYTVYQQYSDSNTDPVLSYGIVERGKMILSTEEEFEYDKYNEPTTYKAYNG